MKLRDPDLIRELDLAIGGYTLATYRVSGLHPNVLSATEALIVTRQTDPRELQWLQAAVAPMHWPRTWAACRSGSGVTYASPMPTFKGILNDVDIAAIVSHERTSWGNAAPLVSPADVAELRE